MADREEDTRVGVGRAGLRTVVVAARRAVKGGELRGRDMSLILVANLCNLPEELVSRKLPMFSSSQPSPENG